jgi:hypothetical protein
MNDFSTENKAELSNQRFNFSIFLRAFVYLQALLTPGMSQISPHIQPSLKLDRETCSQLSAKVLSLFKILIMRSSIAAIWTWAVNLCQNWLSARWTSLGRRHVGKRSLIGDGSALLAAV